MRFEQAFGVTDEHPTNWNGRFAGVIPRRGAGGEIDAPLGLSIPIQADLVPFGATVMHLLGQSGQAPAFELRTTPSALLGAGA